MPTHAAGSFIIDSWDEETLDELAGGRMFRVRIGKTFSGDLTGMSVGWMTMAMMPGDNAAYVGFERITAELGGQAGTFVLHHNAAMSPAGPQASWLIVPGSGTGELAGISGAATIDRHEDGTHTYTLDYDLPA